MPSANNSKTYEPVLCEPAKSVKFHHKDGSSTFYQVWIDHKLNTELVQCDLCGKYLPLTTTGLLTHFVKHRGTVTCSKATKRSIPVPPVISQQPTVFLNEFHGAGPLPSRSETPDTLIATPIVTRTSTPTIASRNPLIMDHQQHSTNISDHLPSSSSPPETHIYNDNSDNESNITYDNLPPPVEVYSDRCEGQPIQWPAGSVWDTYAFQQHDDDSVKWTPIAYDGGNTIRLQSKACKLYISPEERQMKLQACHPCAALPNSRAVSRAIQRSLETSVPHTPWKYLSARQLRYMLAAARKKSNSLRLQLLNANRRMGRMQKSLNDYKRIIMLVSCNKIAGISRILSVALQNGANAEAICLKLHRAIEGTYSARGGWSQREFDVAFLVKAIGGPRLLYALRMAEGYPSVSTLRARNRIPEVAVSTHTPSPVDIQHNITSFLGPNGRAPPPASTHANGVIITIDGIAIEEGARYDFQQSSIVGLCREHSSGVKTKVDNLEDIHAIAQAIEAKSCHYGKDATVLGIAPVTRETDYHVTPLVISASCKTESGDDLAVWVSQFIDEYNKHPHGARLHGPICTLATDGESSFRRLRFHLTLRETLDRDSDLGRLLYPLPGVNLQTGNNNILGTCDPKHIIKRFATLLRSPNGIQVGRTHITSLDTLATLQCLPGTTKDKAILLLNPADKQNVPKAVNLIQCMMDLKQVDFTSRPSLFERARSIVFIGEVLGLFLTPFIDVQLSLSEQIRRLSAYSHLITAMYWMHNLSFMSSALIADSQAIVKHIIITTARLQLIDRSQNYFILLEGTDRLENLFSQLRTQDHSRNFDLQQLGYKVSIAAEIDAVFQRQPDLNRGHARRNLVNARGVDRSNPKSWNGNVCVGDVDIEAEYTAGRTLAMELLRKYFPTTDLSATDFVTRFSKENCDHLRPNGTYIGFKEADEARETAGNTELPTSTISVPDSDALDITYDDDDPTVPIDLTGLDDTQILNEGTLNPLTPHDDANYILVDGKKTYIPAVVNAVLGADRERKKLVTTRALRVAGLTVEQALRRNNNPLDSSGDDLDVTDSKIKSGDLGAVLVRVGNVVCLAIAEVISFRQGTSKTNLGIMDADNLDLEGSKAVTVAVQFLQLVSSHKELCDELTWWWPQEYIQVLDADGKALLPKHTMLWVPGRSFYSITAQIIYSSGDKPRPIWSLSHQHLSLILSQAWDDMEPDLDTISDRIQALPLITGPHSHMLPYHILGNNDIISLYIPSESVPVLVQIVKLKGTDVEPCFICGRGFQISNMRNHVGGHILKAYRDIPDESIPKGQGFVEVGPNACGWCGRSDTCKTYLQIGKTTKVISDCKYHYQNMQYLQASVPSNPAPCTNIPLLCSLCPSTSKEKVFWKYNFIAHTAEHHINEQTGRLPFLPLDLWATTHISKIEGLKLGVSIEKTNEWRNKTQSLDSDDVKIIREEDEYNSDAGDNDTADREDTVTLGIPKKSTDRSRKRAMSSLSTTSSRAPAPQKKQVR